MVNRKNANLKSHFEFFSTNVAPGAAFGGSTRVWNLHDIIEAINPANDDGMHIKVHQAKIAIRGYIDSAQNAEIAVLPIVVQTAGTWATTQNQASRNINLILDPAIDDVYGYDRLSDWKLSKVLAGDGTFGGSMQMLETTVLLPQKILQILNKETETERLQDLLFGIVGISVVAGTYSFTFAISIDYTEERKKIIIR